MNKKLIVSLLAISTVMSFGKKVEAVLSYDTKKNCDYTPTINIKYPAKDEITKSVFKHTGIRIYTYFTNENKKLPTTKDLDVNGNNSNTSIQTMQNGVYRIITSYPNVKLEQFAPIQFSTSFTPFKLVHSGNQCYQPYLSYDGDEKVARNGIVVEDMNGNILFGKHPTFNTRVGLLDTEYDKQCPSQQNISFTLDTEDSDSDTKYVGKTSGKRAIEINKKQNLIFHYCAIDYRKLPETYFDYVVLKLDAACPSNSYEFIRRHDSEDKNNANSVSGFISPNEIENNAKLRYCYVPSKYTQSKYPFDKRFGVFANLPYDIDGTYHHQLHVDDEDNDNSNYWEYSTAAQNYKPLISLIINGKKNTDYNILYWDGPSLAKKAIEPSNEKPSAEISAPVANKASATITNVTHDAIKFDLKTAGNAEVFLTSVNGQILAKISAKNLQPGSNTLSWNTANISKGQYIAVIKHNSTMSSKHVILK